MHAAGPGLQQAHLRPCPFIDAIVNGNYGLHIILAGSPAFAAHGIVKHLLTGIHPDWSFGLLVAGPVISSCRCTG